MDESEFEQYVRAIYGLPEQDFCTEMVQEQQRDEIGVRVNGCFRTIPSDVY